MPPTPDSLKALVQKWLEPTPQDECTLYTMGQRTARHVCATQLRAALSAQPGEGGEDAARRDAELIGVGYMLDGIRVDPSRISFVLPAKARPVSACSLLVPTVNEWRKQDANFDAAMSLAGHPSPVDPPKETTDEQ